MKKEALLLKLKNTDYRIMCETVLERFKYDTCPPFEDQVMEGNTLGKSFVMCADCGTVYPNAEKNCPQCSSKKRRQ